MYINNPGGAVTDVSVQDVLDPAFVYVAGSMKFDNSVDACADPTCTGAEEAAIFAAASLANAPLEWLPKSWGPNLRWLPGINLHF